MVVAPALRRWTRLLARCSLAAAVLAAAQLGVGHGLGIIDWGLGLQGVGNAWARLLTWVAFVFAIAVVGGVAVGRHTIRSVNAGVASWITAAIASALGAAAVFPLVWLPVRAARPTVTSQPELAIGITVGAGIVVGAVLAVTALAAAPIARSVAAGVAWGWLFALGSAVMTASTRREQASPRLGMIDIPDLLTPADWWFGSNLMIVIAAALAAGIAWIARRAGASRPTTALSGLAGPSLIASSYVIAGPGFGDQTDQIEPYFASLIAAGVGLLASIAVAATSRRPAAGATLTPAPTPTPAPAPVTAPEPASPPEPERTRSLYKVASPADRATRTERASPPPEPPSLPVQRDMDTRLRRREKEHVDWVHNLVHGTTPDPEIKVRRRRS